MLHALVLLTLAQPLDAHEIGNKFGSPETERCRTCHPQHHAEWSSSVHAVTRRRLPVPPGGSDHPGDGHGGEGARDLRDPTCLPCHGGEVKSLLDRKNGFQVSLSHAAERSISCTVCHQFAEGSIPRPGVDASGRPVFDPRPRAQRRYRQFHENLKPPSKLSLAGFCGPCHQVTAPGGLELERTFAQFLQSPYPLRDITCTTCHMGSYGGPMVPDGIYQGGLHRHDVIGVDVAANPVPAVDSQHFRVSRFLTAAAAMFVRAPDDVVSGRSFELSVEVINSGAGHNLPAGMPAERRMWLEVDVTLDDGTVLLESGHGERDEAGEHGDQNDGPRSVVFTDRFLDAAGNEVPFWWQAARVEERSLRALERREAVYTVEVPAGAAGRSLHVEVRLRFQACSPRQLRMRGLASLIEAHPIFDMRVHRASRIPVVERLYPPDAIVVPDDVADIHDAIEGAPDGGEVLVRPGTYTFTRPLRFGGKRVTLRGLAGPAETVLRRDPGGDGEARDGSVIVLDAAEGTSTRVEGFTITGGRGTLRQGRRLGGGILCAGANPTIVGNRITGNRVEGDGGGVCLLDSRAVLVDNVIDGNAASGSGGGVAVAGASEVRISGGELAANAAGAAGGALSLNSGSLLLDDVTIAGNRAGRGGGLALRGTVDGVTQVKIVASRILGNAAPLGGGLHLDDIAVAVDETLIAGNVARIGGAIYLRGDRRIELANVTLTENTASRGGAVRCRGDGRPSFRNAILWGNSPPDLTGVVTHSLVEDPEFVGGSNIAGLPYFSRFPGRWARCEAVEEPGCVPLRWAPGRPPRPIAYGRWVPGDYGLIKESPCIDVASPDDPPDPDGTRPDMGAYYRPTPLRGFVRGDVDGNGKVEIIDVLCLLGYLAGGERPTCEDAADIDDGGEIEPVDLVRLLLHEFGLGIPPAAPFPDCGVDPTLRDGVGCFEAHERCR